MREFLPRRRSVRPGYGVSGRAGATLGFAYATAWLIYDVATRHWLGLLAVAGMDAGFGWLARHAARQRRELEAWREELKRLRRGPGR